MQPRDSRAACQCPAGASARAIEAKDAQLYTREAKLRNTPDAREISGRLYRLSLSCALFSAPDVNFHPISC